MTSNGDELTGTYTSSVDLGIGVVPGIVAFVNNYTAVEVSVGVLGVDLSRTKHKTDHFTQVNSRQALPISESIYSL